MSARADLKRVLDAARRAGCAISVRGNSHYRIDCPNGAQLTASCSGKRHAANELRRDLRKYGGITL